MPISVFRQFISHQLQRGVQSPRKGFSKEPIISLHVPKCGGQSFGDLIRRELGESYNTEFHYPDVGITLPDNWNLPETFIHGHFEIRKGYAVENVCPGVVNYITLIRDPYEACLSDYFYGIQNNFEWATSISLEKYFEIKTSIPEGPLTYALPRYDDVCSVEEYCGKFMLIGVLESMDLFLDELGKLTSVPLKKMPILNEASRPEAVRNFREMVEEKFHFDFELYNYVKSLGCYVGDWSGRTNS